MAWIEVQSTGSGNMARGMRQVAGFRVRSGCVIGTCKSGLGEEDLCWGKPLDEVHGPLTARTWPGSRPAGQRCIRCRRRLMEQAAAEWEHLSACAVGHPAEGADTREASREDVLQEAAQELFAGEPHDALLAAVGIVLPAEGDLIICNRKQSMVRDGGTMNVTGQIVQHMFRSAKGWLGIDDPVLLNERAQKDSEVLLLGQRHALAVEPEFVAAKSPS